jgi:triacylglycerol lipase
MQHPKGNPVLLIHGIDDTTQVFNTMTQYLKDRDWQVHRLNLVPNNGDRGLDQLAQQIATYVDEHFEAGQPFDLVGFSMGGIVSRYYLQRLGGLDRVQRFITISSPHQGTWMGFLRWNAGASQMRPHSPFLEDLNQDLDQLKQVQFTSIWTSLDLMILPANSSVLPVGDQFQIPVALHPWMLRDRRVLELLVTVLQQP